jgi:hypothetical protein
MTRYLVAALVAGFYIAGSVWLVRSEGESYRRSLRSQARPARQPDDTPVAKDPPRIPVVESSPPVTNRVAEVEVEQPTPSPVEPPIPSLPIPPPEPPREPPPVVSTGPSPLIARPHDPVTYDTQDLTPEEERRLGLELHELILSRHTALDRADLSKRARQAARSLFAKGFRREMPDEAFTILDSEEVFAFSHPGGYFYLSSGLFALLSSEEELRFVIAHEMAHLERKHALKRVEAEKAKMQGLGTAEQLYRLIAAGYTADQDYEADAWALKLLLQLEQTRRECLAFLRKFKGYSEEHGFENGRKKPKFDVLAPVQDIENHYRAHPAAWERLERLESAFAGLNPRPSSPR